MKHRRTDTGWLFGVVVALIPLLVACDSAPAPTPFHMPRVRPPPPVYAPLQTNAEAIFALPSGESHTVVVQQIALGTDQVRFSLLITNSGTTDIHVGILQLHFRDSITTGRQALSTGDGVRPRFETIAPGESTLWEPIFDVPRAAHIEWLRYRPRIDIDGSIFFDA